MGGLADLLFFGLLLWFVLRAAGKAAEQMRDPSADGEAEGERAGPGFPFPGDRTPRREGAGSRRERPRGPSLPSRTGEGGLRGRLMEDLRRWEAQQRTTAPRDVRSAPSEIHFPRPAERVSERVRERPSERAPRRLPERDRRSPERISERIPERLPERAPERARAGGPVVARQAAARRSSEEVVEVGDEGLAAPVRRGQRARLPDLSRYGSVQRAILWGEILGPPRALRD